MFLIESNFRVGHRIRISKQNLAFFCLISVITQFRNNLLLIRTCFAIFLHVQSQNSGKKKIDKNAKFKTWRFNTQTLA